MIESLAAAVEAKDTVTSRHLRAVSRLATQLAREVEPSYCDGDDFLFGCLLHDVGKIGVPEKILMKPGALTDDEWEVMRRHPQTGARVVRPLGMGPVVTDVVLYHHERWDGRGYPDGLAGDEIPLAARIFSVCDALEAMTAARPYRGPLPVSVAFERVKIEAGHQFDPDVIAALSEVVVDVVLYHHERWDGGGYPQGLAGDDIPLVARIFSVCDALEAMTAMRRYRDALPASVAYERVRAEAGTQFDPAIVRILERGVSSGDIDLDHPTGVEPDPGLPRRFSRDGLVGFPP